MPIDDELIARAPILLGVSKPNAKLDDLETNMTIWLDPDQRRTVKNVSYKLNDPNYETTLELDSHAYTCVLGRDALIILDYQKFINLKIFVIINHFFKLYVKESFITFLLFLLSILN